METIRGYPVKVRRVQVGGQWIELLGPANFDELIDDPSVIERFRRDEYMPYWAEFWPACLLLADVVAGWGPANPVEPLRVLEFGCGLGLVGLVAASLGYEVTMSDYDDDALEFVRASAAQNRIAAPATRFIDWRETYPELRFDRIVAAEVLYETRNLEPIAQFIAAHVAQEGFALVGDRNRTTADRFPTVCREHGLDVSVTQHAREPLSPGDPPIEGRIFRCGRA